MDSSEIFDHLGYRLTCSARPDDSGSYLPMLTTASLVWPSRPRVIAMPKVKYSSRESAISAAHEQGIEWVAAHG